MPSPEVSVHDLVAENFSHRSQTSLLLYLTSLTPDSGSSAASVKETEVEVVYASPLLISMEPVGGVISFAPLTSAKLALKTTNKDNNSNRNKNGIRTVLLSKMHPLLYAVLEAAIMNYAAIFYLAQVLERRLNLARKVFMMLI